MRELKFRVWNKYNNSYQYDLNIDCNGKLVEIDEKFQSAYVIQQYTGLKDKNSKEIYEGDIVKIQYTDATPEGRIDFCDSIKQVVWCEYDLKWAIAENPKYLVFERLSDHRCNIEVIGNIFETPKMLK